jgi:AraC family transcriptional activator of pobA
MVKRRSCYLIFFIASRWSIAAKKTIGLSKQHLHANLFQLFLVERGKVTYEFEDEKYLVSGPVIVTIPENMLHGLVVSKNIQGMVLTLSTSFLETVFSLGTHRFNELSHTRILKDVKKVKS